MSNKKATHSTPHKYERGTIGNNGHTIYKCMLPGCTHYLPHSFHALNQLSLCWGGCGNAVMMDKKMIDIDKIKHPFCSICAGKRAERRAALIAVGKDFDEE